MSQGVFLALEKNTNRAGYCFYSGVFFSFPPFFFFQYLQINMSTLFLYEDGYGNGVDENGGPELMDYIVDQNEFIVETMTAHSEYLKYAACYDCSRLYN
ncbi:uncharacterized protein BX663DRAFT_498307 [Cokeromyces recurvatus]|uniref:uncharacterized protein n=1 Tax=Cokeromyces recurvatus TaxID=90255 RepID=UPI00221F72B1|nr:uncharacterized protein BX663DRAFT_498307 [Cokeromyces recurvatus]KAI7905967.1 hypothetical protein BX663DRAFT_498307 [Cokeromyces recurvatus]